MPVVHLLLLIFATTAQSTSMQFNFFNIKNKTATKNDAFCYKVHFVICSQSTQI